MVDESMRTYPIPPEARRLHEEICRVLAVGEMLRPGDVPQPVAERPAPEMLLDMVEPTRALARQAGDAAEHLLAHVVGGEGAPSGEELEVLAGALSAATDASMAVLGVGEGDLPSRADRAMAEPAFELYRETGLARLGLDLFLGVKNGREAISAKPVDSRTAHVWQLGRLFERIGTLWLGDELLGLERRASHWWFSTHSAPSSANTRFSATVREQEWSLVERRSLLLGAPLLDVFLGTDYADSAPESQRSLAAALQASFASGFTVLERVAGEVVLEDLVTGRTIEVHEHNDETEYEVGSIALGRVAAFEGSTHLRSPGMVFHPPDEALERVVRKSLRSGPFDLPAPVRVEVMVSRIVGQRDLPRKVAPARSRSDARELLQALTDALEVARLTEDVPAEDADPGLVRRAERSGLGQVAYRRYDLDTSTGAWMRALSERAGTGGGRAKRRR